MKLSHILTTILLLMIAAFSSIASAAPTWTCSAFCAHYYQRPNKNLFTVIVLHQPTTHAVGTAATPQEAYDAAQKVCTDGFGGASFLGRPYETNKAYPAELAVQINLKEACLKVE